MLSSKEIVCPNNLLDLAHKKKGIKVFGKTSVKGFSLFPSPPAKITQSTLLKLPIFSITSFQKITL